MVQINPPTIRRVERKEVQASLTLAVCPRKAMRRIIETIHNKGRNKTRNERITLAQGGTGDGSRGGRGAVAEAEELSLFTSSSVTTTLSIDMQTVKTLY
jgi:hypothetical protein